MKEKEKRKKKKTEANKAKMKEKKRDYLGNFNSRVLSQTKYCNKSIIASYHFESWAFFKWQPSWFQPMESPKSNVARGSLSGVKLGERGEIYTPMLYTWTPIPSVDNLHGCHRSGNGHGKKTLQGQGNVREFYSRSGKIGILKKSQPGREN